LETVAISLYASRSRSCKYRITPARPRSRIMQIAARERERASRFHIFFLNYMEWPFWWSSTGTLKMNELCLEKYTESRDNAAAITRTHPSSYGFTTFNRLGDFFDARKRLRLPYLPLFFIHSY
jgi:hypothetical protein